jgi:hypothetical protein
VVVLTALTLLVFLLLNSLLHLLKASYDFLTLVIT